MNRSEDVSEAPRDESARSNAGQRALAISRMIETAITLIARRGASKLSLVDVGRESGYSHSLPNYYFKSKKRLLLTVYAFISQSARERIKDWPKAHLPRPIRPGLSNIEATVLGYLGLVREDPVRSRAMYSMWSEALSSMPELLEEVRPWNAVMLNFFEAEIRTAIQRGEIDPSIDPPSLAAVLVAMMRGLVAQYLLEPEQVDLGQVNTTVITLLRNGVAPVSSDTGIDSC